MYRPEITHDTLSPLILNSTNLVPSPNNNRFRYQFPITATFTPGDKIAISNITIYNSWFNISTSTYNNASYQVIYPTSVGSTTLSITMPDGSYDVSQINAYLQSVLILNGLYLVNSTGENVYYIEFVENPTFYSIQLNCYQLPTSLPSGWSNPGSMTFPATPKRPQLVVSSTNNFGDVIGYAAGTYPTSINGGDYSTISTKTPQVSPIQSLVVSCSLLNNKFSNPNTILYSFGIGSAQFGEAIISQPSNYGFIDIQQGSYSFFDIIFLDQDFRDVKLNDTNLIVQLLLKT